MELSNDLISQFVKVVTPAEQPKKETTVYGTIHIDGQTYVKLDGSDVYTPVSTTVAVKEDDRVTVMIKNHSAVVTGNLADPSASVGTVTKNDDKKITTTDLVAVNASLNNLLAGTILSNKIDTATLETITADIESLRAVFAAVEDLTVDKLKATTATIERLDAIFANITDLEVDVLDAVSAEITNLKGYTARFTRLNTQELEAVAASIMSLNVIDATIQNLETNYANIDFANIGEAAVKTLLAQTGIINGLTIENGTVTGDLTAVTIKGDKIEANTIKADSIIVKDGQNGLYYKLNFESGKYVGSETVPDDGIDGRIIVAESITADKINVSDLTAFGATIAGFRLGNRGDGVDAIYSHTKPLPTATARGIYLDSAGLMAVGDSNNYIRYYEDKDGQYKLEVAADEIKFKTSNIKVGARNLIRNSEDLIFGDYVFPGTLLDTVIEEQESLIITMDAVFGTTTVVNTVEVTSADNITTILDEVLAVQTEILATMNEKLGGDA